MSTQLTTPQKSVLIKAYRNGGFCKATRVRGEALERRGYGKYSYPIFYVNRAGINYATDGVQLGVI